MVPGYGSKEAIYIVVLTGLLVLRTFMSIWLADVNGMIVRAIVKRSLSDFIKRLFYLMLFAIPSSAVNSGIEFLSKLLALAFRTRLTDYLHNKYLQKMFYYKVRLKGRLILCVDLQLGLQNFKSRPKTHSGFGQVGCFSIKYVPQLLEACAGFDPVLQKTV